MARRSDHAVLRLGTICLIVLLVVMAAAFNLQKFPGFRGTGYSAEFADASGLHEGNMVQIAGVRVGRINDVRITGDHVTIDFDVHGAELGPDSRASVEVLNLLGEKYLEIQPAGSGTMTAGGTIPASRTDAGYDIVSTLGELTTRTQDIDVDQLSAALTTLGDTLNAASPEIRSSFTGLSRISRAIASRDDGIETLLERADRVTRLLNDRKGDLVTLMKQGDLVFRELIARRDAIHSLLVNARRLGVELRGVAADNQEQIGPALAELKTAVTFLEARKDRIQKSIHNLGPYASILINIVGTGPWFDAYVPNFGGLATGEFVPGPR
ncbi:MAG TPA: MCE family protein [Marmoricola sp.]|jgi:phospholipid/cholesterol/gamma-HCH transport system substrate-binding protein|nr:MCE family protein [Marmoricola sp.]